MRALGEEPVSVACLRDEHCIVFDNCVLEDVWHDVANAYAELLNAISIDELVRREAERKARDVYCI
jgi:DNA-binding IscR family transcriptional regulator